MVIENRENSAALLQQPDSQSNGLALEQLYRPIAKDLARAEEILRDELDSKVDFVAELTQRVRLYEGKRIRPALLLLAGKACGAVGPEHHTLAAVIEMIHAATLVHDDVLDDADLRRHVHTVNAEWGTEASVLLGDYLFTHSFHLAATLGSTLACRWIGRATNKVCEGELHQVSRRAAFDLTQEEYESIIAGKTAELIACACRLGAHFAGADAERVTEFAEYGRSVGMAFQIADDLLDLTGFAARTGKTAGTDLAKQKLTLPLIRFRDTATPGARARLRVLFDAPGPHTREAVLDLLSGSDAIDYTRRVAESHASQAERQLSGLAPSEARDILARVARFTVARSS